MISFRKYYFRTFQPGAFAYAALFFSTLWAYSASAACLPACRAKLSLARRNSLIRRPGRTAVKTGLPYVHGQPALLALMPVMRTL